MTAAPSEPVRSTTLLSCAKDDGDGAVNAPGRPFLASTGTTRFSRNFASASQGNNKTEGEIVVISSRTGAVRVIFAKIAEISGSGESDRHGVAYIRKYNLSVETIYANFTNSNR